MRRLGSAVQRTPLAVAGPCVRLRVWNLLMHPAAVSTVRTNIFCCHANGDEIQATPSRSFAFPQDARSMSLATCIGRTGQQRWVFQPWRIPRGGYLRTIAIETTNEGGIAELRAAQKRKSVHNSGEIGKLPLHSLQDSTEFSYNRVQTVLMKSLEKVLDASVLHKLLEQNSGKFNSAHIGAAWLMLSKFESEVGHEIAPTAKILEAEALRVVNEMPARSVCSMTLLMSRRQSRRFVIHEKTLVTALLKRAQHVTADMNPSGITSILSTLIRHKGDRWSTLIEGLLRRSVLPLPTSESELRSEY